MKTNITVYLDVDHVKVIDMLAESWGVSRNMVITELVTHALRDINAIEDVPKENIYNIRKLESLKAELKDEHS